MRRRPFTIHDLAIGLLWELCHEWGLRPRKILHVEGVRWLKESEQEQDGPGTWTRVYERKPALAGAAED